MEHSAIPVLISLQSSAPAEGEAPEVISLITTGDLQKTDNGYLLGYEETLDDDSLVSTRVELLLEKDEATRKDVVTMQRTGEYDVNMVFRKGQRYEGQYHTPFGDFDLALFCTKVGYRVDDVGGELHLQYQLDMNGQYVAMHTLELQFCVKENYA